MELRLARPHEVAACYECIEDARAYHRSLGFVQWGPAYPTAQTILDDIDAGIGYVFAEGERILGYCCIMMGDESAYHEIQGAWKTDRPYAVVHRMAFSAAARGSGRSQEAFRLIRALSARNGLHALRIDTMDKNTVMQHILEREGFQYCGIIYYDGGPRLAYEWDEEVPA